MKLAVAITLMSVSFLSHAQDAGNHFKKLLAIEGAWSMQTKRGIIYEHWQVQDGRLQGKSFKVNGKDTVLLEKVSIVINGNDLFYIPVVEGQNNGEPVRFKLVSTENETFIFDNPRHDYPQRVIYQLPRNDSMHTWIEGLDKGVYRKSDFFYKRVK